MNSSFFMNDNGMIVFSIDYYRHKIKEIYKSLEAEYNVAFVRDIFELIVDKNILKLSN